MAFHGKTCAKCKQVILGESALEYQPGEYYHKKCFVCSKCNAQISGDVYESADGSKICEACIPKRKCEACGKDITGACRCFNGKDYHPECLVCSSCKEPLKGAIFQVDGKLSCEPCAKGEKKPAPAAATEPAKPSAAAQKPLASAEPLSPAKPKEDQASPSCRGYVYKKKGRRGLRGWDWRYFVVTDMQVAWWKNEADAKADSEAPDGKNCKGCIDLLFHPCKVVIEGRTASRFHVTAEGGEWAAGDHHWKENRSFLFDAKRSEHLREVWVSCISANIQRAAGCRANPPRKGVSFVSPEEQDMDVEDTPAFSPPARQDAPAAKAEKVAASAPAPVIAPVHTPTPAAAQTPAPVLAAAAALAQPKPAAPSPPPVVEAPKPVIAPVAAAPAAVAAAPTPAPAPAPATELAPAPSKEEPVQVKAMAIPDAGPAPTTQTSAVVITPLNQHVMDKIMTTIETNLVKLKAANPGAVSAIKAETNILVNLEKARDNMMTSIQDTDDKDRKKLLDTWGGDCNRIARLRAMLEAVELTERNKNDKRLPNCLSACEIIERLLREKKLAKKLEEAQEENMPWRPPPPKAAAPESAAEVAPAKPKAAASPTPEEPAPTPAAPAPAPKQEASIPTGVAADKLKKNAPATGTHADQNIMLSAGEAFDEEEEDPIHLIAVEATGNMGPDVEFGPNGTFVLEMPHVSVQLNTEITPPLPPLNGETQVPPYQEVILDTPQLNGFIFDPAKKNGKFAITVQGRIPVVHVGGAYESKANLVCQSPWGSMKLREGKEDTELHWTVDVRGRLGAEQTSFSNLLFADVVLNITISLSGPGSAKFSKDGKEMPLPDHSILAA